MKGFTLSMAALLLLSGCATAQQERAATRGAAAGAVAGAVIGAPEGRAAEGAFFGGLVGAATGAVMAGSSERRYRQRHFDDEAYLRRYAYDD